MSFLFRIGIFGDVGREIAHFIQGICYTPQPIITCCPPDYTLYLTPESTFSFQKEQEQASDNLISKQNPTTRSFEIKVSSD